MKLRRIKRAAQRRMFSPRRRFLMATSRLAADLQEAYLQALEKALAMPPWLQGILESMAAEMADELKTG